MQPVSSSTAIRYFTVEPGSGVRQISGDLKAAGIIRNAQAFETYVRSNEYTNQLQAGTYALSQAMSVQQIVDKMVGGEVAKNLLTILPGKRLDQIKRTFGKAGYNQAEINRAFDPAQYRDHPALAGKPASANLEGYLYPDSYQKQANTPAATIIRQALDEMAKYLTPARLKSFAARGLSSHQAVTLASIIYQETDNPKDQPIVAQVFYSRLADDMPLGSDVTAYYAAYLAGRGLDLTIDSPYNTRLYGGLPPGPISNVTAGVLRAASQPAKTDYLYFLSGDDDKMHFARTQSEHEANIAKYCQQKCQQ